jgi:hypothetical protein
VISTLVAKPISQAPDLFYRYQPFSSRSLQSLCEDTLYFCHPGHFNDPLDCKPTLECDSSTADLRSLLAQLVGTRVASEIRASLRRAQLKGTRAEAHARTRAELEAKRVLEDIAYHSTNPDYEEGQEVAETNLLVNEIEDEMMRHYELGVCCFSEFFDSALLWSHYADQHRGICVGYDCDRDPVPDLKPVSYGGKRAILTSVLVQGFLRGDAAARAHLDESVLLRKAAGWSYESEWRLIRPIGEQDSPMRLREITCGLRCSPSAIYAVCSALKARNPEVDFYGMGVAHKEYSLVRQRVDHDELERSYPRTAQSGAEMFPDVQDS